MLPVWTIGAAAGALGASVQRRMMVSRSKKQMKKQRHVEALRIMYNQFADIAAEEEAACREYVAGLEALYLPPEKEQPEAVPEEINCGVSHENSNIRGGGGSEPKPSIEERILSNGIPIFWMGIGGIVVTTTCILAKNWVPMLQNLSDTIALAALGLSIASIMFSKLERTDGDVMRIEKKMETMGTEIRQEIRQEVQTLGRQLMTMGREHERSVQYVNQRFDAAIFSLVTKSLGT